MKIYLVRHGQTDWNREGMKRMQCQSDNPLNEIGIKQAEQVGELLDKIDYDFIFSSPYIRAKRTAEIANRDRMPIIVDDRLKERYGGVVDGKPFTDFTSADIDDFFNYNENVEYEGAESMQDFCKRVWDFLDDMKEKYKDKTVVFVAHNILIRAVKAYFVGIPEDGNIRHYGIDNGELVEYTIA